MSNPSDPAAPLDVEAEIAAALAKPAEEIAYEFRKQTPTAPLDVERLTNILDAINALPSEYTAYTVKRIDVVRIIERERVFALATPAPEETNHV